jgi:hypothetical protein
MFRALFKRNKIACLHKKRCNYEFNKYLTLSKQKKLFNLYVYNLKIKIILIDCLNNIFRAFVIPNL